LVRSSSKPAPDPRNDQTRQQQHQRRQTRKAEHDREVEGKIIKPLLTRTSDGGFWRQRRRRELEYRRWAETSQQPLLTTPQVVAAVARAAASRAAGAVQCEHERVGIVMMVPSRRAWPRA
jgi:hypothetical protein